MFRIFSSIVSSIASLAILYMIFSHLFAPTPEERMMRTIDKHMTRAEEAILNAAGIKKEKPKTWYEEWFAKIKKAWNVAEQRFKEGAGQAVHEFKQMSQQVAPTNTATSNATPTTADPAQAQRRTIQRPTQTHVFESQKSR